MKAPTVLTGMFGEFVVIGELRKLGFDTDWDGGLAVGGDVRAQRGDRRLWLQVKSSTVPNGQIAYGSAPEKLSTWQERAVAEGREPWFALVHFPTPARVTLSRSGVATVKAPQDAQVTAVTAEGFSRHVEAARDEYARRRRRKRGHNGEVGDLLPRSGLLYPAHVDDFEPIDTALSLGPRP